MTFFRITKGERNRERKQLPSGHSYDRDHAS